MKNRLFQRANASWCKCFDYPEKSLLGKTTRMLYESDEEYDRVGRELYTHLRKGNLATTETRLRRSDGAFRDVVLTAALLRTEDPTAGTVVSISDVTERKQAEAALQAEADLRGQPQRHVGVSDGRSGFAADVGKPQP